MPGGGNRNPNSEVTPYRRTHVILNDADTVLTAGPFSEQRANGAICQGGLTPDNNTNIFRLSNGGYCLMPMSVESHYLRERTDNASAVLQTSDFNLVPGCVVVPGFKSPADLPGVTVDTNVATTGNNFIRKNVTSSLSQTFSQILMGDSTSYVGPILPTANVPMDRLAVSNNTFPENQGFYFTFLTPSHKMSNQDFVANFYFGGPVLPDGSGAYCLSLGGDGKAILNEFLAGTGGASNTWIVRDRWQYTLPQRNAGLMESVMVFPYTDTISGQSYIEFRSGIVDASPSANAITAIYAETIWHTQGAPSTHLYTCAVRPFGPRAAGVPPPVARLSATGPGHVRVEIRRDLRIAWQVALLRFANTGTLTDLPFYVPHQISIVAPFVLTWTAGTPGATSIDGRLYDASTGVELTLATSGPSGKFYTPNPGQQHYFARFFFSSAATQSLTPTLSAYSVVRDALYATVANNPIEMLPAGGGKMASRVARSVNISGPEGYENAHDTAQVMISDITSSLAVLAAHSYTPIRIESEYDTVSSNPRSVYFNGYVTRAEAARWGSGSQPYPSPYARDFDTRCTGHWARLRQAFPGKRQYLTPDPAAPIDPTTNARPAFKVTDILRAAFGWAGYSADMIDVPDNSMRFFPPANGDPNGLVIDPLTHLADFIEKTAADYLGWWVIFDPNAGTGNKGMWRAVAPNITPYTNLASFVTSAGAGKMQTVPQSYGTPNWVATLAIPIPQVPILKKTLRLVPKPPEANKVLVTASGSLLPNKAGQLSYNQTAQNLSSYNCIYDSAGHLVITADPTSLDYVGFEIPLYYLDPTLQNQKLVDIITRRLYNFTCHGTKLATFTAPLALVLDPNDTKQIRPRPLRFYDPVLLGGVQYLVRSVNPYYTFDGLQMARYECETPRF